MPAGFDRIAEGKQPGCARVCRIGATVFGVLAAWALYRYLRPVNARASLLMGVLPEYRKLGVDMAMVYRTMQAGFSKGITSGECSWILEDNIPMNRILEGYGADCYKTYRIYEKKVG